MIGDRVTEIKGEEGLVEGQLESSQSLEEAERRKYLCGNFLTSSFSVYVIQSKVLTYH